MPSSTRMATCTPTCCSTTRAIPPPRRSIPWWAPGSRSPVPNVPVAASIGHGKDTDASRRIVAVVDRPHSRPVWVLIWGGSADLAQALWHVRATRSPAERDAFVAQLRVHAIYDQDSTGAWIKQTFPDLFYITRGHGVRGMYRGGDLRLVGPDWVETHVRRDHGALGALYPNYDGGDIWSQDLGRVRGVKEGDTPSLLALLPNGLGNPEHPEWGSWGGRCVGTVRRFADAPDDHPRAAQDPDPRLASVYRWRPAFQADFAARLDWCVRPYATANHPPTHRTRDGLRRVTVAPGAHVLLDGRGWTDPDGMGCSYQWSFAVEPSSYDGRSRWRLGSGDDIRRGAADHGASADSSRLDGAGSRRPAAGGVSALDHHGRSGAWVTSSHADNHSPRRLGPPQLGTPARIEHGSSYAPRHGQQFRSVIYHRRCSVRAGWTSHRYRISLMALDGLPHTRF